MNNPAFNGRLSRLKSRMDLGEMGNRKYRLLNIHLALKEFVNDYEERPQSNNLTELTQMILHEELSDTNPDKVTKEEYPILSDTQLARRQEGKHRKKEANYRIEVPFSLASNIGSDGRDYSVPARRERSLRENMAIDKGARSRNEERRKKYEEFTKVQPVKTYKIED